MWGGSLRNSALPSKPMSGIWAVSKPADSNEIQVSLFMARLLFLYRMQQQFLRPPQLNFGHEKHVGIPAIDLVQSAEFAQLFARLAELADHCAVELHLVH